MIMTLLTIALAFYWLLRETDYLRVRLLIGADKPPKYARYKAYTALTKRKTNLEFLHKGNNYPEGYTPNGEPEYTIILNPGIDDVLCGWDWLDKHCADLVDYTPKVDLKLGGVSYSMTIKPAGIEQGVMDKVMKVNKLSKQERNKYAMRET